MRGEEPESKTGSVWETESMVPWGASTTDVQQSTDQRRIADPEPGPLDDRVRTRWIRELREALDPLLDAWFPRCIDHEYGGFLCDFDYRWKASGPHRKMLEFQARQTRLAAIGWSSRRCSRCCAAYRSKPPAREVDRNRAAACAYGSRGRLRPWARGFGGSTGSRRRRAARRRPNRNPPAPEFRRNRIRRKGA